MVGWLSYNGPYSLVRSLIILPIYQMGLLRYANNAFPCATEHIYALRSSPCGPPPHFLLISGVNRQSGSPLIVNKIQVKLFKSSYQVNLRSLLSRVEIRYYRRGIVRIEEGSIPGRIPAAGRSQRVTHKKRATPRLQNA